MSQLIVFGVCVTLYVAFFLWYRSFGKPLTQEKANSLIEALHQESQKREGKNHEEAGELLEKFKEILHADDGKEFFMINLMKFKNSDPHSEAMQAHQRYSKAIIPFLLKYGGHPVFVSNISGKFLYLDDSEDWDQVGIIRYRSRRDFLRMALDVAKKNGSQDKWISMEKTQVFPTKAFLNLGSPRIIIGFILLIIFLVISLFFH